MTQSGHWLAAIVQSHFSSKSNPSEIAVPTKPISETASAGHTVFDKRFAAVVPFLNERLANAKPVTFYCRASVRSHASLRKNARSLLARFTARAICTDLSPTGTIAAGRAP